MNKEKVLKIIEDEIKRFEEMIGHQSRIKYSPYEVAVFLKELRSKLINET